MKKKQQFLSYRRAGEIKLKCSIRLDQLFETDMERKKFEEKWGEFKKAKYNSDLYRKKGNVLQYDSEQLIPSIKSRKLPLLLVFGNPAGQSVLNGMFFSFEGDGKEHRMWRSILEKSKLLELQKEKGSNLKKMNASRRKRMLSLDYESKFRIGMSVFITMPSPADGKWGGVAGVKRLLGARAFRRLEAAERDRVIEIAKGFIKRKGAVVAFQKNAWDALRRDSDQPYRISEARACKLKGTVRGTKTPLFGVPPTRLTNPCRDALAIQLGKI